MVKSLSAGVDPLKPEGYQLKSGSLLLTTFAVNILSLALPIMTLQVYDRILPHPGSGTLPVLITGVCLAIVLETLLRLSRSYAIGWSGMAYEHRLACQAMGHVLQTDFSRFGNYGMGEHLHRMSSVSKLKDFYNGYAMTTVFELVFVPLFLGLVYYIAGPLVIVPFTVLLVFTLVSFFQGRRLRKALESREGADDARYNFLIETLDGIHSLKAFALESQMARRYEQLEEKSSRINFDVTEASSAAYNTGAVFSHIMIFSVITFGAFYVLQSGMTTGALIATILLSGRMMQPVQKGLGLWSKYQDYTLARQKAVKIFEAPLHPVSKNVTPVLREGRLDLNTVSFQDPQTNHWVLKDVDLSLKKGDCFLLSGEHGTGKSAFLDLLSGVYLPSNGEIRIDDVNIMDFAPETLIEHVGYVRADGLIFNGTIRDNITCFGQIPQEKAGEIAALLKVDRDVARLPAGFDTYLSGQERDNISPGLKQRIAMVRVLAPKPRLILFDNADRALDREGYNMIYSLLARLTSRTAMIIVSEDQNIRGLANRYGYLEGGKLVETDDPRKEQVKPFRELRI